MLHLYSYSALTIAAAVTFKIKLQNISQHITSNIDNESNSYSTIGAKIDVDNSIALMEYHTQRYVFISQVQK